MIRFKTLSKKEKLIQSLIIKKINPFIEKSKHTLNVGSYDINPQFNNLEVSIENPTTNKKIVFGYNENNNVWCYVYLDNINQHKPNDMYSFHYKNIFTSKRLNNSLDSII